MIKEIIDKGEIVPVKVTVNLLKKAMEKAGWADKKFLVDGFPRNQDNYDGWNEVMGEISDVKFVLFLECSEQTMIDRVKKRAAESGDNKRSDDNIEILQKRFRTFIEQSMPIVEIFEKFNKVRKINAEQAPEEVYKNVTALFNDDDDEMPGLDDQDAAE